MAVMAHRPRLQACQRFAAGRLFAVRIAPHELAKEWVDRVL